MAICIASVNGQWTNWSQWSRCSRTCNGGTRSRRRSCSNPPPSNGGAPCSGPGSQSQFCGRIPCQFIGVWILILQLFHLHFFLAILIVSSLRIDRIDIGDAMLAISLYPKLSSILLFVYLFFHLSIYLFLCYNQLGESYHIGPLGAHAPSLVAEEPERVHVAV